MGEEKIKEYVKNGGILWNIERITTIRDGGTKMIILPPMSKLNPFYIHKDNWTIHTEYPLTDDNILTDEPTREYLFDRLDKYKENCEWELKYTNNVIKGLKQNKDDE